MNDGNGDLDYENLPICSAAPIVNKIWFDDYDWWWWRGWSSDHDVNDGNGYEDLPICSAAPVVNKILYLQREHLEATAAASSSPAAVWERVKKTRRGLEQQDGVVFSGCTFFASKMSMSVAIYS